MTIEQIGDFEVKLSISSAKLILGSLEEEQVDRTSAMMRLLLHQDDNNWEGEVTKLADMRAYGSAGPTS